MAAEHEGVSHDVFGVGVALERAFVGDTLEARLLQDVAREDRPRLDIVFLQIFYDGEAVKRCVVFDDEGKGEPRGRGVRGLDRGIEIFPVFFEKPPQLGPVLFPRSKELR